MRRIDNASMKDYTTYKTGGVVKYMYFVKNKDEFISLIQGLKEKSIPFYIIGNGSNLVIDDSFFNGAIINVKEMNKFEQRGNELYCECGAMLPMLATKMVANSYKGLEWAISIPGTIGGSIYNNAGAYNNEMAKVVKSVEVLDENNTIKTLKNGECDFTYRSSIFKLTKKYIILSCLIKLEKAAKEELKKLIEDRKQRRLLSQPLEYPSAGSVFRNPDKNITAGRLIDELGLKGYSIKDAQISEKHANFIINKGNATSKDIKNLIKLIQEKVLKKYNIKLILEQEIINWE